MNNIYNKKVIPYENKDDEYKTKAGKLYDKYTNPWEHIRTVRDSYEELKWGVKWSFMNVSVAKYLAVEAMQWATMLFKIF